MSINQFIIYFLASELIRVIQVDLSALHGYSNGTDDEAEPHCSQIWGLVSHYLNIRTVALRFMWVAVRQFQ